MNSNLVFADDRLVHPSKLKISPLNSALFFGESLLEAIPVYDGKPLFIHDHWERLRKGCRFLGWPVPPLWSLQKAIRLFADKETGHFLIRFSLVQEVEPPAGPRVYSGRAPRLLALIRPLRHRPEDFRPPTGKAGVGSWTVAGPSSAPGQFKWIFYMMIRQEFRLHPQWDEMLRLDETGFVADGGSASPFWFADGVIRVPSLKKGGLESVTRGKILQLCRSLGVKTMEKGWKPSEALKKGELFFAGSGLGIMSVSHLGGKPLNRPAPLALRLWQHYRSWALNS